MSYEATDKIDDLGNEGTQDGWEKKKKKSASTPEKNVNKSELYI